MPFITPATLPGTTKCRQLVIPDNDACNAVVVGAIYELTRDYNWEERGGASVADTVALFQSMFDTFSLLPDCPVGGTVDYELQDDITLSVDATTYTIADLDLLSGRDLLIEMLLASTHVGLRDFRIRVNTLTTSIYERQMTRFGGSSTHEQITGTYFEDRLMMANSATPQLQYYYCSLDIPDWKQSVRYPIIRVRGTVAAKNSVGSFRVNSAISVDSLQLFLDTADIKAGSKIWIYTRG